MAEVVSNVAEIAVPDGTMAVFTHRPTGAEKLPAILVIQEGFGVIEHIRGVGQRLAAEGYFTASPVLYHRTGPNPTA